MSRQYGKIEEHIDNEIKWNFDREINNKDGNKIIIAIMIMTIIRIDIKN